MKYAKRLSLISPEALRWGKRVINRGAEIAGFRAAIEARVDSFVSLYATKTDAKPGDYAEASAAQQVSSTSSVSACRPVFEVLAEPL